MCSQKCSHNTTFHFQIFRGLVNPTCDGGYCNQNSLSQADMTVNPTCDGIGWCDQRSSVNPSCNGGQCDQSYSANPSCIPDENCIEDGSRTYDANGNPHPNDISIKDIRLLAEEMEADAKVDATISSKNGSTIMTLSIATVFTVLGFVAASF